MIEWTGTILRRHHSERPNCKVWVVMESQASHLFGKEGFAPLTGLASRLLIVLDHRLRLSCRFIGCEPEGMGLVCSIVLVCWPNRTHLEPVLLRDVRGRSVLQRRLHRSWTRNPRLASTSISSQDASAGKTWRCTSRVRLQNKAI